MKSNYKVFIWDNVLSDYTEGYMFAVARTVEEARRILKREYDFVPDYDLCQEPKVYAISKRPARAV